MTVLGRLAAVFVWTGLALLTSACGEAAYSPTSPSGNGGRGGPSRTTGAVITGSVNGMPLSTAASLDVVGMASKPVTVTVVGTNISTTIDGSGRFQLNNVPVGDVQLKFTGAGLDATLTVKGVNAGDWIDIRVRLTDTSVRIEAERRERRGGDDDEDDDDEDDEDDEDEDEFKGTVSALSGTCPNITFTLNGTTVKANNATRFEDGSCARMRNNARVEVHGRRQTDGSIQADRIEFAD